MCRDVGRPYFGVPKLLIELSASSSDLVNVSAIADKTLDFLLTFLFIYEGRNSSADLFSLTHRG